MRFCPQCQRALIRAPTEEGIEHVCSVCGTRVPGTPMDARIGGSQAGGEQVAQLYKVPIRIAPFDPTTQQVAELCTNCGRDYMSLVRVGDQEIAILACKCGVRRPVKGSDAADAVGVGGTPAPAKPGAPGQQS